MLRQFPNWIDRAFLRVNTAFQSQPTWLITFCLFLFSLGCTVGDFDAMVNVDFYNLWSVRTARFMRAISRSDFPSTYQSHHPGVTLMWIMGLIWRAFGVLAEPLQQHPEKVRLAVWPIAVTGAIVPAATFHLLSRLLGPEKRLAAASAALLLATEPLWVAHSRNPHLDILATGFAWLALLGSLIARREGSRGWAIASGSALGLALLSKISTLGIALGIALTFTVPTLRNPASWRRHFVLLSFISVSAAFTLVALWPALVSAPVATLFRWENGLTHETDKAIPFMLFGHAGLMIVPSWVYALYVVFLITPELCLPAVIFAPRGLIRNLSLRRFYRDLVISIAPLVFLVLRANNVGVRNIILLLPMLATLTALTTFSALTHLQARKLRPLRFFAVGLSVLLFYRVARLVALFPLPITYCSTWTTVSCSEVFQVGWGEGMREAAAFIAQYSRARGLVTEGPTVYGGGYIPIIRVWTKIELARNVEDATLLIDYLPDWQRRGKAATNIAAFASANHLSPLHEVRLNGRLYVRIYRGPQHAETTSLMGSPTTLATLEQRQ